MSKKRSRHTPEQIIRKLRDGNAGLTSGKTPGEVVESLEVTDGECIKHHSLVSGSREYGKRHTRSGNASRRTTLKALHRQVWNAFSVLPPCQQRNLGSRSQPLLLAHPRLWWRTALRFHGQ